MVVVGEEKEAEEERNHGDSKAIRSPSMGSNAFTHSTHAGGHPGKHNRVINRSCPFTKSIIFRSLYEEKKAPNGMGVECNESPADGRGAVAMEVGKKND